MRYYESLSEAWVEELRHTRASGRETAPRGMPTVEQRWAQFGISNPLTFPLDVLGREFRDVIGVGEGLQLVGQFSVPEILTARVKNFANFTDGGVFHGAYGARAHGQLEKIARLLENDPDTRQAVLSIFDTRQDLGSPTRDVPCTLSIHFMRRDRYLDMRVTMRSNDLWLGTPYDLTQFAILQASMAQAVGCLPGDYVHSAGSLHLYERDFDAAAKISSYKTGDPGMGFPLWGCADDIGEISQRARQLVLGGWLDDMTEFEAWCEDLLR